MTGSTQSGGRGLYDLCVLGAGDVAGFWPSANWPTPGDAPAERYQHELTSQPQTAGKVLLGICLPPLWSPTHFAFVRKKLEEPKLSFLTSAPPFPPTGTFLNQTRVEVTRENKS